jgi:hypothetical protein
VSGDPSRRRDPPPGGITGFTAWRTLQAETVAPRRLPDGLLEVQFPGTDKPVLVLVEIETYPDSDVDRQVLDDLMLIAVDRKVVPEVVSLVLKPKGNLVVSGTVDLASVRGGTRVSGSWPVVRLWEQDADRLLAAGDVGLIPWVPLAHTTLTPEETMARCRDRLLQVPDPGDRAGLTVVTQILAGLAFPNKQFLHLFGGPQMMIDSPVLDEVKALMYARAHVRTLQEAILACLEARFGIVSSAQVESLSKVEDAGRLKELVRLAATCADLDAFAAGLAGTARP